MMAKFVILLLSSLLLLEVSVISSISAFRDARGGDPVNRVVRDTHEEHIVVDIGQGSLKGRRLTTDGHPLGIFLGIPYAEPPIGARRFAKPEPHTGWSGVRDALKQTVRCIHRHSSWDPVIDVVETEDCLVLDVYAPLPWTDEARPVMIFLHGGGFYAGSGALYDFRNVAKEGVIVVVVGFRLDVFGFLSTEDAAIPGNFGILDANMALDWVKTNIKTFGGNPYDITMFGGSSGSAMVSIMMLSPLTRGHFQKAILQSGVALCPWAVKQYDNDVINTRRLAAELGAHFNCTEGKGGDTWNQDFDSWRLVECLRNVDASELIQASVQMQEVDYASYSGGMIWIPVVEKTFGVLPKRPLEMLQDHDELVHIPTIHGYSTQDGSWLVPGWEKDGISKAEFKYLVKFIIEQWFPPEHTAELLYRVLQEYLPVETEDDKTPEQLKKILVDVATDASMVAFIVNETRLFDQSRGEGQPSSSFVYEFNHRPSWQASYPEWYGVGHADEKGFILGLPNGTVGFQYPQVNEADVKVKDLVVAMWTNFAKHSTPTKDPVHGVTWPAFGDDKEKILKIQENPKVEYFSRQARVKVWTDPLGQEISGSAAHRPLVLTFLTASLLGFMFSAFW